MMVYNTQNYWVLRLCPSSGILETRKHNVAETGRVSILRWGGRHISVGSVFPSSGGGGRHISVGSALSKWPNRVGVILPHQRTETDPVSEMLCFLVSRILDDEQSPNTR
jgi:hypothetical protein